MSEIEQTRKQWLEIVAELFNSIETWCQQIGWTTARQTKPIVESKLGAYDAPTLIVKSPGGLIYVEPVARFVAAGDGLVDLYSWPTLRRMILVRMGNDWKLKTDSGVPWPQPWSREAFVQLVPSLAA